MNIVVPDLSLVLLLGKSAAARDAFAAEYFPSDVLCGRQELALTEVFAAQSVSQCVVVTDDIYSSADERAVLLSMARDYDYLPVAIVLSHKGGLPNLEREGFKRIFVVDHDSEDKITVERPRLWNNRREDSGPFDIIGDIHGCFDELKTLLGQLGYVIKPAADDTYDITAPVGRRVIFLGDLCDRGPNTPEVLKLVMSMVAGGTALCVPGNHDVKLVKKCKGRNVKLTHGLPESLKQLESEKPELKEKFVEFIDSLDSHYVLDGGDLVVAHAGMKEQYQGRKSGRVKEFALYGETTGATDENGLPERLDWAAEYSGAAYVVYGHTPVREARWRNRTICLDTGCVYGGNLTALRYPERELLSVPAAKVYYENPKPLK